MTYWTTRRTSDPDHASVTIASPAILPTRSELFILTTGPKCKDHPDPDMFFDRPEEAKAFCAPCPMRTQCIILGAQEEYGVWGGIEQRPLVETNPRDANILNLLEDGLQQQEVAELLDIPKSTIATIVQRNTPEARTERARVAAGHEPKPTPSELRAQRNARIMELLKQGADRNLIAAATGVTLRTVVRAISAAKQAA